MADRRAARKRPIRKGMRILTPRQIRSMKPQPVDEGAREEFFAMLTRAAASQPHPGLSQPGRIRRMIDREREERMIRGLEHVAAVIEHRRDSASSKEPAPPRPRAAGELTDEILLALLRDHDPAKSTEGGRRPNGSDYQRWLRERGFPRAVCTISKRFKKLGIVLANL
jgi:hypothetical protein